MTARNSLLGLYSETVLFEEDWMKASVGDPIPLIKSMVAVPSNSDFTVSALLHHASSLVGPGVAFGSYSPPKVVPEAGRYRFTLGNSVSNRRTKSR
ncbi:hypothetical protein L1049_000853 [Liquidambar formosana]|uniref:Uncharacterized protein n=1 Tax=Liquidambar formosana TaxID=63359 RepID=A0AAP0R534_LIQFO